MGVLGWKHKSRSFSMVVHYETHDQGNWQNWCFWAVVLGVPWTARRSNQSILKEINPEYWLDRLMLQLKLQYFGHMMGRTDSLEKTLKLRKIEDRKRRGRQRSDDWMVSPTQWIRAWASSRRWWRTGKLGMLQSMELQRVRHDWVIELNWLTERALLVQKKSW